MSYAHKPPSCLCLMIHNVEPVCNSVKQYQIPKSLMSVFLSFTHPFGYPSTNPLVHSFICPTTCLFIFSFTRHPSTHPFFCPSTHTPIFPPIHPSSIPPSTFSFICPFICPLIFPFIHLSSQPSVHLSTHPSTCLPTSQLIN